MKSQIFSALLWISRRIPARSYPTTTAHNGIGQNAITGTRYVNSSAHRSSYSVSIPSILLRKEVNSFPSNTFVSPSANILEVWMYSTLILFSFTASRHKFICTCKCFVRTTPPPFVTSDMTEVLSWYIY